MKTLAPIAMFALSLTTLLPAAALAHGRDEVNRGSDQRNRRGGSDRRVADRAFITVTNDNATPLQVLVDRKIVGTVPAQSTARFGSFDLGEHKVRVRYAADGLRFPVLVQRVDLDGRFPARLVAPVLDTGIITLQNQWIEPMIVELNGQTISRIPANGRQTIRVDRARGTLQFVTLQGNVAASRAIRLSALEQGSMALVPPSQGTVTIFNPSATHSLDVLCSRGMVLATVPPNSARQLDQSAGRVTLTAAYRGAPIETATVIASPFDRTQWTIDLPDFAPLSVRNPNTYPVNVYSGGVLLGQVEGRGRAYFPSVAAGWTSLEVTAGRRDRAVSTVGVDIDPLSGGLLTVPRMAVRDGRGSSAGEHHDTEVADRRGDDHGWRRGGRRSASGRIE